MATDHDQGDDRREPDAEPEPEAHGELATTAEQWREGLEDTEAEDSADEVARGAERAAEQPDYGREGS